MMLLMMIFFFLQWVYGSELECAETIPRSIIVYYKTGTMSIFCSIIDLSLTQYMAAGLGHNSVFEKFIQAYLPMHILRV